MYFIVFIFIDEISVGNVLKENNWCRENKL